MLALVAPLLLTEPLTFGSHTLDGRTYHVWLPTSPASAQAPVAIILHGRGGTGQMGGQIGNEWPELKRTHIVVGPDGPEGSWNVKGDPSTADDKTYVGATLIDHLATFANVDASRFAIIGNSNGAALANRLLIENDDARITHIVTDSAQLNTFQYRDGAFYEGGPTNAYTTIKSALTPRRVLQIVGGLDDDVPASGGATGFEDGAGGFLNFVPWEDSALAIATAFGYAGAKATLSPDDATIAKASYLSGLVVAVNIKGGTHVVPMDTVIAADAALADFLTSSSATCTLAFHGNRAPNLHRPIADRDLQLRLLDKGVAHALLHPALGHRDAHAAVTRIGHVLAGVGLAHARFTPLLPSVSIPLAPDLEL